MKTNKTMMLLALALFASANVNAGRGELLRLQSGGAVGSSVTAAASTASTADQSQFASALAKGLVSQKDVDEVRKTLTDIFAGLSSPDATTMVNGLYKLSNFIDGEAGFTVPGFTNNVALDDIIFIGNGDLTSRDLLGKIITWLDTNYTKIAGIISAKGLMDSLKAGACALITLDKIATVQVKDKATGAMIGFSVASTAATVKTKYAVFAGLKQTSVDAKTPAQVVEYLKNLTSQIATNKGGAAICGLGAPDKDFADMFATPTINDTIAKDPSVITAFTNFALALQSAGVTIADINNGITTTKMAKSEIQGGIDRMFKPTGVITTVPPLVTNAAACAYAISLRPV